MSRDNLDTTGDESGTVAARACTDIVFMTPHVTIAAIWSLFSFLGQLEFAVGKLLCDTALPHWTSDCLDFR